MANTAQICQLCVVAVPLLGGCQGETEPDYPTEAREIAEAAQFRIILGERNYRVEAGNWRATRESLSNIEVHETTPKASDGSYTAVVSFDSRKESRGIHAKVRVTYRVQRARIRGGGEIATYPVDKVELIESRKIGRW